MIEITKPLTVKGHLSKVLTKKVPVFEHVYLRVKSKSGKQNSLYWPESWYVCVCNFLLPGWWLWLRRVWNLCSQLSPLPLFPGDPASLSLLFHKRLRLVTGGCPELPGRAEHPEPWGSSAVGTEISQTWTESETEGRTLPAPALP